MSARKCCCCRDDLSVISRSDFLTDPYFESSRKYFETLCKELEKYKKEREEKEKEKEKKEKEKKEKEKNDVPNAEEMQKLFNRLHEESLKNLQAITEAFMGGSSKSDEKDSDKKKDSGKKEDSDKKDTASSDKKTERFEVIWDFRGFEASDITVKIENKVLKVNGKRKVKDAGRTEEEEKSRQLQIPDNVDIKNLRSDLSADGVLVISAPYK